MPKSKQTAKQQPVLLITNQEKQTLVDRITADLPNIGSIFLPDDIFYDHDESIASLNIVHKSLCDWLGINPKTITISFNQNIEGSGLYEIIKDKPTITINAKYAGNPFQIAAIEAHLLSHHVLNITVGEDSIIDQQLEELVDLVSLQGGLGLIVLNGYGYSRGWLDNAKDAFHKFISGQKRRVRLGHFTDKEYAKLFIGTCNSHHILSEKYSNQLVPGARKIIKNATKVRFSPYSNAPKFVRSVRGAARRKNLKITVIALILVVTASLISLKVYSQPKPLTPEQQALQGKAHLLRRSYDLCQENVKTKRSVMDSSDLFVQQSIDAKANRCDSLRNQYNATVDEYNQSLAQ